MLDIDKLSKEPAQPMSDGVGACCAVPGGVPGVSWRDDAEADEPEGDGAEHDEPDSGNARRRISRWWDANAFEEEVAFLRSRDAERLEKGVQIEQEAMAREYEDFLKS